MSRVFSAPIFGLTLALAGCAVPASNVASEGRFEEIHILRSIREARSTEPGWCSAERTGFAPFARDAERFFSFWSLRTRPGDGKVVETKAQRVATLRGCFGPTSEPARQNFFAEIRIGTMEFHGNGECLALRIDFPETGLFPVRCQLVLSGMQAPYVGGLLTTNTITSKAPFGADTDPPGYTQASIATIRLWKAAPSPVRPLAPPADRGSSLKGDE
ncbi:hypothetical protein GE253_04015 [Niveispirillum sp. SYP-B3756]|uniref:hypothetical protein n=1 Tax=Niveispirillum sp. SYP-B3756 TaxID=2662178 RepID=UPI0012923DBB|nr:hypothetical protein [Niveispirillum sp. SYP-B3756]MQP64505.1 hypothetical protein [Niveispirillum sp. SYP-B3756]